MAKRKKENLSMAEITADYTVLSEEIKDGYIIAKLRTHNGYIANCRIPIHTEEEKEELSEKICESMIRIAFPDLDLSEVKYMEVQF